MQWWQWLVGILMFILALGVLVGIHELGHLAAAKAFKVYCFNYSIGFGPALISSKRSKKHETIWTLRAIPLGGFVSMYGEGAELDTDEYVPPSRSLEGVARYKRGIIVSAGVILNFVLGYILIFSHNAFFDHVSFNLYSTRNVGDYYGYSFIINADEGLGDIKSGDALKLYSDPLARVSVNKTQTTSVFILANDITIETGTEKRSNYALCFKNSLTTTKVDPDLTTSLALYEQKPASELIESTLSTYNNTKNDSYLTTTLQTMYIANESLNPNDPDDLNKINVYIKPFKEDINKEGVRDNRNNEFKKHATTYYEKISKGRTVNPDGEYKVSSETKDTKATLNLYKVNSEGKLAKGYTQEISIKVNESKNGWANTGIRLKRTIERYDFVKSLRVSGQEWCNANTAVFRGLGMLFTGSGQVSGIIGIAQVSSQTLANFGFERYLYLWGMISCNLAILNLLPFPGLDGFTLLVTAYEGIRKKQVPTKLKGIISLIGLALLFTLMIFILIKDIMNLI